jgi:hypothetical protein
MPLAVNNNELKRGDFGYQEGQGAVEGSSGPNK